MVMDFGKTNGIGSDCMKTACKVCSELVLIKIDMEDKKIKAKCHKCGTEMVFRDVKC